MATRPPEDFQHFEAELPGVNIHYVREGSGRPQGQLRDAADRRPGIRQAQCQRKRLEATLYVISMGKSIRSAQAGWTT